MIMSQNQARAIVNAANGLREFSQVGQVMKLCRVRTYEMPEMRALVTSMYNQHIDSFMKRDTYDGLAAFGRVCYAIDFAKTKTIGLHAPTDTSNAIIQNLMFELMIRVSWSRAQLGMITEAEQMCSKIPAVQWLGVKYMILSWNVAQAVYIDESVAGIANSPLIAQSALVRSQIPNIGELCGQLTQGLLELRSYGVKPCFFSATKDFAIADAKQWVVEDALPFVDAFDVNPLVQKQLSGSLATFGLARLQDITSLEPTPVKDVAINQSVRYRRTERAVATTLNCWLNIDGSLSVDMGINHYLPLQRVFKGFGFELVYDVLRLQLIMHLFDLTVPVFRAAKLGERKPRLARLFGFGDDDEQLSKVLHPELVLQRVKLLQEMGLLRREIEEEIEQAEEDQAGARMLKDHGVIYHKRVLPPGKKASPKARELAAQYGFTLKENETFVRPHRRGTGSTVGPHHAVVRN